jgi:hypothetical protein
MAASEPLATRSKPRNVAKAHGPVSAEGGRPNSVVVQNNEVVVLHNEPIGPAPAASLSLKNSARFCSQNAPRRHELECAAG